MLLSRLPRLLHGLSWLLKRLACLLRRIEILWRRGVLSSHRSLLRLWRWMNPWVETMLVLLWCIVTCLLGLGEASRLRWSSGSRQRLSKWWRGAASALFVGILSPAGRILNA